MTEDNFKKKLADFILASTLAEEQKSLWQLFLKISDPREDALVLEAVAERADNLAALTEYLRDKIWSMKKYNRQAWERLIDDESDLAEKLS